MPFMLVLEFFRIMTMTNNSQFTVSEVDFQIKMQLRTALLSMVTSSTPKCLVLMVFLELTMNQSKKFNSMVELNFLEFSLMLTDSLVLAPWK